MLIALLIHIIIALIIIGLVWWLLSLIPLPPPFPEIIRVVIIVGVVLWLLSVLLGYAGHGVRVH